MASVFVVDLACLACGRGQQVTVGAMRDLPAMPARCTDCSGSVLAISSTQRVVREPGPIDWYADRPHRGRPPARAKQRALELREGDQSA
jgi:hypothetical protein